MKLILLAALFLLADLARSSHEQVEIHASLCPSSQDELLMQLEGLSQKPKERDIWYLDQEDLLLNNSGKILRIRKDLDKKKVTITVKLRGLDKLTLMKNEVDCEKDWYGEEEKISCSLNSSLPAQEWDRVIEGKTSLNSLFSSSQRDFLNAAVDWERLKIFGPIRAHIWKFEDKTLEIWSLNNHGNKLDIYEASTRAPLASAKDTQAKLLEDLYHRGVELCSGHESKTRTVLEFLSQ